MGTAHYLSPEQALGRPATPKSDLYSLGVVLYEMLTGELPYDAETPFGILMEHVSGQLRPPKEVNPEVTEGLNAVVVRLLAQDLEDRYPDAAELIEDLEQVRRGKPATPAEQQTPSPASTPPVAHEKGEERRGWHWITVPLIILLLALTGGAAYALFPETTAEAAVPDLVGVGSIEEARALAGDEFEVVEGSRVESREAVGTIVAQTPEPGETDQPGEISVDVAGTQITDLPDVEGETREEAERILEEAGFEIEVASEESSADYEGYVTEQDPPSDGAETAEAGSTVEIKLGEGPADTEVAERASPSPGNQTRASNNRMPAGPAVAKQPAPDTKTNQGNPVTGIASSDPKGLPAPAITGENVETVQQPLTSPPEAPTLPIVAGHDDDDRFDDDDDRFDDDDDDRSDDDDRGRGRR
jgi:serine/threonine-protein kinase